METTVMPVSVTDSRAPRETEGMEKTEGACTPKGHLAFAHTLNPPPTGLAPLEDPSMVGCTSTVLATPLRETTGLP